MGAPGYTDGDWWKVRYEREGEVDSNRCDSVYPAYIVKIEKGKSKVYGVQGASEKEIECSAVIAGVLGTPSESRRRLHFPL